MPITDKVLVRLMQDDAELVVILDKMFDKEEMEAGIAHAKGTDVRQGEPTMLNTNDKTFIKIKRGKDGRIMGAEVSQL